MTSVFQEFLEASFIWKNAILASMIAGFMCSWLGVYIAVKRVVFIGATVPQVSGLGIALAFYIGSYLGPHGHETSFLLTPTVTALVLSCLMAFLLALHFDNGRFPPERLIAVSYILASALIVIILASPRIVQESHEIGDILFGNAVVVSSSILKALAAVSAGILFGYILFFKKIAATLFDEELAVISGLPTRFINLALYLSFAVLISVATRALGALPVFGFLVIPPAAGLMLANRLSSAILVATVIGVLSAAVGYFISFVYSLPTGAVMVSMACLGLVPGFLKLTARHE